MLKQECNSGLDGGATTNWARICDTCQSAPCTVYCRADSAFLCTGCDARIHAANLVASRHERVWVCEACERAPAAFLCKADAASLCAACDSDIHSANPLARRHHRVPIAPIPGTLYGGRGGDAEDLFVTQEAETIDEADEDEAASWLLLNPDRNQNQNSNNLIDLIFGEEGVDGYLDLDEYNSDKRNHFGEEYSIQQQQYRVSDQKSKAKNQLQQQLQQYQDFQLGLDYEVSNAEYGYPASSNHSVSVSSMEVGVVPESSTSDVSNCLPTTPKGSIDLLSSPPMQTASSQLTPMDRVARVLRYREKKKTRKFEKTIRYASRKAYAETRPRIKGRFAKRTDLDVEVDQMFSSSLMAEGGYGIVPSF